MAAVPTLSPDRRALLARRIRWFVAATISYNVIEAVVALSEGARVSSTALIGFGLDSVIEVSSAAAVAWLKAQADVADVFTAAEVAELLLQHTGDVFMLLLFAQTPADVDAATHADCVLNSDADAR